MATTKAKSKVETNGHNRIADAAVSDEGTAVTIKPPKFKVAEFKIRGTAPLVQNKFSEKARNKMLETQKAGQQAKGKKVREARKPEEDFKAAMHISREGWNGIPCAAFRGAMIDACRLVGFKMTIAKLAIFILADGVERTCKLPLVKIDVGQPEMLESAVRNANGSCDLRFRPCWEKWEATLRVRFDEDQMSLADVTALLSRAGMQCGVGEGRPNSKQSFGQGWGTFEVAN